MKLQDRSLALGMQGDDVRKLQRQLVWLSYDIASPEIADGRFGETTQAAVERLNTTDGHEPAGVVDSGTVEAINKQVGTMHRVVRGNLRHGMIACTPNARHSSVGDFGLSVPVGSPMFCVLGRQVRREDNVLLRRLSVPAFHQSDAAVVGFGEDARPPRADAAAGSHVPTNYGSVTKWRS
jgi:hypothetical protein